MDIINNKKRAPLNRTITVSGEEMNQLRSRLMTIEEPVSRDIIKDRIINQDLFTVLPLLPDKFIDLLFIDPPYNLTKSFNSSAFKKMGHSDYEEWLDSWLKQMVRMLKPDASVYICCDWQSSNAVYNIARKYFIIRSRITWEREKGRGSKSNWKNCSEDIWFCTVGTDYKFNVEAVKMRRKVMAPYRHTNGEPKDWENGDEGNYRTTHPSNLWTDITVPFWSMSENTDHPTQKPEKLTAKIILASTNAGDFVFDPFLGSGTTAVTAKKLNRSFCGVEIDPFFSALALKRLDMASEDDTIQGYSNGVFWERNSANLKKKT